MLRHFRLLLLLCTTLGAQATFGQTSSPTDTLRYVVDAQQLRQHWDGWGVSLCWWAGQCGKWDDEKIDEIISWLVSPDGLNYSHFRYNIGGGDGPRWRDSRTSAETSTTGSAMLLNAR